MSELADHPILKKKEKHVDVHGHHAASQPLGIASRLLLLCLPVIPATVALPCGIAFALTFQFFDYLVNSLSYGSIYIVFRGQRMQSGFSLCRKRYQQCVGGRIENIYPSDNVYR